MGRLGLLLAAPLVVSAQLAIESVTVIDARNRAVLPDTTVLIEGQSVTRVGPTRATPTPRGFRKIDGRNRYLIPGLWDCHVHLTKAGPTSLALFIANGVTSVRDMGSDPAEVLRWRAEIDSGRRIGPRIKTPGRILESRANVERMKAEGTVEPVERIRQPFDGAEEARRAVAEMQRLGVDHLKVRTVPDADSFQALADAARSAGLPLTGHPVGEPRSLFGEMKSLEHLLAWPPLDVSESERRRLYRQMCDSGTWMSTTAVNLEGSLLITYDKAKALLEDSGGKLDRRRKYAGGYLLSDWREQVEEWKTPEAAAMLAVVRSNLGNIYRDFGQMREEGVKFLAGTDVGVAFMYPGFSIHDELEIYTQRLGFAPMEALRVAVHNPAEFFGIEDVLGGINEGQSADLVLLDRNPLEDIRNTTSIRAVIARGNLLDRAALDKLLEDAARSVK